MFRKVWLKVKRWWIALLVAIGLIPVVLAASKDFSYVAATEYTDGTPLPLSEIAETRLYCDAAPTPKDVQPGANGSFTGIIFAPGDHSCYATHVATNGMESGPSNVATFTVLPEVPPNAPSGFSVN